MSELKESPEGAKKKINSKNKGNSFERKMAKTFSLRFAAHTGLSDGFRRNSDSGSFFGSTNQKRIASHGTENANFGDLIIPETFQYCLECKHYKAPPSLNAILRQDWKLLDDWIGQARQDADNAGKHWMVVVKFNNIDEFVVLPKLFGTLQSVFVYKGFPVVPLKLLFEQPDEFFFSK